MATQKIFGIIVTEQKIPLLEKPSDKEQCYICGFTFGDEDCMHIYVDSDIKDRRKAHAKCIQNHLQLLPKDSKLAIVSLETNEILSYTPTSI